MDQIIDTLDKQKDFLRRTYKVSSIGIFGSYVRAENKKASDVDLLVEFYEPIGFFKFTELEEILGKLLEKKVDLVTKKALKPVIRDEILQEVVYV